MDKGPPHHARRWARCAPLGGYLPVIVAMFAAGCGGGSSAPLSGPGAATVALSGIVHGGQNPVADAQVFAYQAGNSGYGRGEKPLACTITNAGGSFNFSGSSPTCTGTGLPASLSCPASGSPLVYLLAVGGSPASGVTNTALVMSAALGNCNALSSSTSVIINEVTTVASVWTLSQFMNCSSGAVNDGGGGCTANSRELGASATNASGLANAMALGGNIANLSSGQAQSQMGGTTPPTSEINTLGDILQDCVNSNGTASTACRNLFTCVVPGATPKSGNLAPCTVPAGSLVPADTLTAALDIALNPVNNVTTLFNLTSRTPAFTPALAAAPSDWTIALNYTSSGVSNPDSVAIDAGGNAWVTNVSALLKISPIGAFLNGGAGYTGGGLVGTVAVAIDPAGNVWTANFSNSSVTELNSQGAFLSGPGGYTGGGLNAPGAIAIDAGGNAWIANVNGANVTEISPAGEFLSGTGGYIGGGLNAPSAVAIDAAHNAWVTNSGGASVTEIAPSGEFLSGAAGYTAGLNTPQDVAIDPAGNAWVSDLNIDTVVELSSSGVLLKGFTFGGLRAPSGVAIDSAGNAWVANCGIFCLSVGNGSVTEIGAGGGFRSPTQGCPGLSDCGFSGGGIEGPLQLAVDQSGNVWVPNSEGKSITELVGVAGPVLTPISACLKLNTGRAVCLP
jgi:streptogramin lyase